MSRPESWRAWRNGLGSRLPKKLPACVILSRSPGVCVRPAKSSKSQPFEIVSDSSSRLELPHLVGDGVAHAGDGVRPPGDELRHLEPDALLRANSRALGPSVGVRDERVAQVGNPACPGRTLHGGAHQMHGAGG